MSIVFNSVLDGAKFPLLIVVFLDRLEDFEGALPRCLSAVGDLPKVRGGGLVDSSRHERGRLAGHGEAGVRSVAPSRMIH